MPAGASQEPESVWEMLGDRVTAADGGEAVLRETGSPRIAQSQNVRRDFTAFISDGVAAYRQVRFNSVAACWSQNAPTYTLAMVAAENLRRLGTRFRASTASRSGSPAPRVLVISNVGSFGGGGAVGFRDMVLAIRDKRPDLEVVAVCPWKGSLAAEFARQGIRTKITWIPGWAFLERSRRPRIEAFIGTVPYLAILLSGILPALLLLIRLRPTVVLTNTMAIPSHAIAAKLLGIPHYWMIREFGKDDHRLWFLLGYHRTIRLIGRLSETVICNSQAVEKALLSIDPKMATSVVYPVVDTPLGTPPERHPGEPLRAVLVGYFSEAKGQRIAVEAVALARKAGVDLELTLVGGGAQKPLRELARRLGVEDLVTIDGPTRDVGRYWSAAHVGLMCSQCEAFGRVTVEALRAGLPVCGTDTGGTPEIIDPGVNGLLSPAGDANALAANLMALESDEDLRRSLAFRAAETAQRFQRDRHDDELVVILGLH
jgi:glycosyltransferase involved in cell wall biosynthesis